MSRSNRMFELGRVGPVQARGGGVSSATPPPRTPLRYFVERRFDSPSSFMKGLILA